MAASMPMLRISVAMAATMAVIDPAGRMGSRTDRAARVLRLRYHRRRACAHLSRERRAERHVNDACRIDGTRYLK